MCKAFKTFWGKKSELASGKVKKAQRKQKITISNQTAASVFTSVFCHWVLSASKVLSLLIHFMVQERVVP